MATFADLKERQRAERGSHAPNLALRVHRALSWLERAEQLAAQADPDGRFLFLWIAFNAAYATEIDDKYRESEQQTFRAFLQKLAELDAGQRRFDQLVWNEFPHGIRVLLANRFVFADFWRYHNGTMAETDWQQAFAAANAAANKALARQDTVTVLAIVLSRIYTLRNQLVHGGATWQSSVNRDQVRDCGNLMGKLVPLVIEIMLDHPQALWGDACWPVVAAD